jgi:ribose 5-phosphate isomerase B
MKIAIGSDHRGFFQKEYIKKECLYTWIDVGTYTDERTDYPLYVTPVVEHMLSHSVDYGVLLCSTGIGMAIAANRHSSIYAAVVWNSTIARLSKEDDNCNLLVLPSDYITDQEAVVCISTWLSARFKEGRYSKRLAMID